MYCEIVVPAVIFTGTVRGSPAPRSSTLCGPGFSASVNGVIPPGSPSTTTGAPGGLLLILNVPVTVGDAPGIKYFRAANKPTVETAISATATAATLPRSPGFASAAVCNENSPTSSSSSLSLSLEKSGCEIDANGDDELNGVAIDGFGVAAMATGATGSRSAGMIRESGLTYSAGASATG